MSSTNQLAFAIAVLWPPLLLTFVLKVFPDLIGKALFKVVEHRSEARLVRLRDELTRDTSVHVEKLKADLQADQAALKTSVDFLSATQSGLRAEMVSGVRLLWKAMIDLRREFGSVITFNSIFTREELSAAFAANSRSGVLGFIEKYRDGKALWPKVDAFHLPEQEETRIFVGDKLWLVFTATRTTYFRLAFLASQSLKDRKFHDWRDDEGINSVLRSILPDNVLAGAKAQDAQRIEVIIGHLEAEFLHEANRVVSGSKAFAASLSDLQATLLLQTQWAAEQRAAIRMGHMGQTEA